MDEKTRAWEKSCIVRGQNERGRITSCSNYGKFPNLPQSLHSEQTNLAKCAFLKRR